MSMKLDSDWDFNPWFVPPDIWLASLRLQCHSIEGFRQIVAGFVLWFSGPCSQVASQLSVPILREPAAKSQKCETNSVDIVAEPPCALASSWLSLAPF
jgi:hypothetical protein